MLEEVLKSRRLPDMFLAQDGTRVSRKEDWEAKMRPYLRALILREEYGQLPPRADVSIASSTDAVTFANKAVWEHVSFSFTVGERTHTVPTSLIYPRGAKQIPFFMYINFRPDIPFPALPF